MCQGSKYKKMGTIRREFGLDMLMPMAMLKLLPRLRLKVMLMLRLVLRLMLRLVLRLMLRLRLQLRLRPGGSGPNRVHG